MPKWMNSRIGLILVFLTFVNIINVSGGKFERHIDPSQYGFENPDPGVLFTVYEMVFNYIVSSDYIQAKETLSSVEGVKASSDVVQALDEYNLLLMTVIDELNETESSIHEAYAYYEWLKEDDVKSSLNKAIPFLESANRSSKVLNIDSTDLAKKLGGSPAVLHSGLQKVENFVELLNQQIESGLVDVERIKIAKLKGLQETRIDVLLEDYMAWVGSSIRITGKLYTNSGVGLVGKVVEINIEESSISVVTDEKGFFSHTFIVPYSYDDELTITCHYQPSVEDLGTYAPVLVSKRLFSMYQKPELSIVAPSEIYPGMQYTVKAFIKSSDDIEDFFSVTLRAFGESYEPSSIGAGEYTFRILIPSSVDRGVTEFNVMSKPNGVYGQESISVTTVVKKIPTHIALDNSYFIMVGKPVTVSGKVSTSESPLSNCLIKLQVGETTFTAKSDKNGEFSAAFPQNLKSLSQRQRILVYATPNEPWISSAENTHYVFFINAPSLILTPIIITAIFLDRRQRQLKNKQELRTRTNIPTSPFIEQPQLIGLPGLYARAVQLVTNITGEHLLGSSTIKEYMVKVKPKLWEPISGLFVRFSSLYESWVYGPCKTNPSFESSEKLLEEMSYHNEQDKS